MIRAKRALCLLRWGPPGWILAVRMLGWRMALVVLRRRARLTTLSELAADPRPAPDVTAQRRALRLAQFLYRRTDGTCLERSLLVFRHLGQAGADPELVIGFVHEGDGIIGHAWVEVAGKPVLEIGDPATKYTSLLRFGPNGERIDRR